MHAAASPETNAKADASGFSCIACRGTEARPVHEDCPDFYLGKPFHASYYRCAACGLTQQSPMPRDTSAFYDAYPVHREKSALYKWIRRITLADVYLPLSELRPGVRVLDYGCGDGWFIENLASRGVRVEGFEPDREHALRLGERLGLPVEHDLDRLLREKAGKFDIVTMHFVLEHLPDIDAAFAAARKLLKEGGLFFFTVPNIDSRESRLFGRKWHHLDPPRHLAFPNRRVVSEAAGANGFTVSRSRYLPFPNGFAGSLPVWLFGRFIPAVFMMALPIGILYSRLFPDGIEGFWLTAAREHADE